jgi:hypothetical protein
LAVQGQHENILHLLLDHVVVMVLDHHLL